MQRTESDSNCSNLYFLFVDRIAKEINARGVYFPIFGICLGFELLTYVAANRVEHRTLCSNTNQPLPLECTHGKCFFLDQKRIVLFSHRSFIFSNFSSSCLLFYLCIKYPWILSRLQCYYIFNESLKSSRGLAFSRNIKLFFFFRL